jgi:hypothetical protein
MCKEPLYHSSHYIHAHQWQGVIFSVYFSYSFVETYGVKYF